jgi:glycosyltransferase involved in cell wall biosynthesis
LLSALGLIYVVCKLRLRGIQHLIFYNRATAFLPTLLISSLMRYKNILDLEDGEVRLGSIPFMLSFARTVAHLFDFLCDRALLACSALKEATSIRPILCYYGAIFYFSLKHKPKSKCITILMSGTLCHETGANLLIDSIKTMAIENPLWLKNIRFEITGKGDCLQEFKQLASEVTFPEIVVHGRLSDLDYADVLSRADVGLSLKLNNGPYADTTFPSKVIEYAAAGLLIVATDISDVRKVLGHGALYLERDEPVDLIQQFEFISTHTSEAFEYAEIAQNSIKEICAPKLVGNKLCNFIFGQA